tara:strand:- start:6 stop:206 length:201 start_codon:yes stop_codon:yes gene_type:complete
LITELIKQIEKATDRLVMILEYDMSSVKAISGKVPVLHQDRVLAYAPYKQIKSTEALQAVYAGGTK